MNDQPKSAGGDGACPELATLSQDELSSLRDAPPAVDYEDRLCRLEERLRALATELVAEADNAGNTDDEANYANAQRDVAFSIRVLLGDAVSHSSPSAPAAERGSWRPIAEAPKDGRKILVHWPYWCPDPCVAYYSGETGGWEGDCCLYPTHDGAFPERQPTIWMPLPSLPTPPVESREKESEPWKPEFQPDGAGELNLSTLIKTCLAAPSAPAAAERGSWRPIAEAPRNGRVLLYRPGRNWLCVVIGSWSPSAGMFGDSIQFFRDATHWQPLPTPPDEERT